MRYQPLPLPGRLLSDPEVAWNFWLLLHELSELLWQRHEPLFCQWARDEFGDAADRSPQAGPEPPSPLASDGPEPFSPLASDGPGPSPRTDLATPSSSDTWPIDRFQAPDDDVPF